MPFCGDQPLTLDRGDSLHSAQAKLESAAGDRPIVVLASESRLAANLLTYKLLARASERFASPIAVFAGNSRSWQVAREQGLRAYATLGSLRRARGRSILALEELGPRVRQTESLIPHSLQLRGESVEYDGAADEEADRLLGEWAPLAPRVEVQLVQVQ